MNIGRTSMAILMLITSQSVFAEYVDKQTKEDDQARREIIRNGMAECGKRDLKTVGDQEDCEAEFFEKARKMYPKRGTVEYSEKHYGSLSADEAEQVLMRLRDAESEAGAGMFTSSKKPGVVSTGELVAEGWWIQENVLGVPETTGDPWFMECKDAVKSARTVQRCPLGEGGEQ